MDKTIKSHFGFDYILKENTIVLGSIKLKIAELDNLDKTIDLLCEALGAESDKDPLCEDYCPYFGAIWPSSLGLSQYLIRHKDELQGKRILELGSGLSIPSFVATKLGAKILATDYHVDVPYFLKFNQELNQTQFEFMRLNWTLGDSKLEKFDWVIGSDVLYESKHPKDIAKALQGFVKPGGRIVLADPGRTYIQKFITEMNELGFKENLCPETVNFSGDKKDIFVFEFFN